MKILKEKTKTIKVNNIQIVKRVGWEPINIIQYKDIANSYNLTNFDGTETTTSTDITKKLVTNHKISNIELMVGIDNEPIGCNYHWS
jgi:hypothetical protein